MNKTKFTQGKWRVLPSEEDKEYLRIRGTRLGHRYKIANVHCPVKMFSGLSDECIEREMEESLANARLIEKSGDMYEMLSSVRGELYLMINEVNHHRAKEIHSQTITPPDYVDMETVFLIDKLLAEIRGE